MFVDFERERTLLVFLDAPVIESLVELEEILVLIPHQQPCDQEKDDKDDKDDHGDFEIVFNDFGFQEKVLEVVSEAVELVSFFLLQNCLSFLFH